MYLPPGLIIGSSRSAVLMMVFVAGGMGQGDIVKSAFPTPPRFVDPYDVC